MLQFTTVLKRFDAQQGEKTGWTFIEISAAQAQQLKPGNKKSFRVKGKLDKHAIKGVALMPMGGGSFIMAVNADMRKAIGKGKGAELLVQLQADDEVQQIAAELLECLADEPMAKARFDAMPKGHQRYYSRWIESAKTDHTRAKRIAYAVNTLAKGMDYGAMIRSMKADNDMLPGR